MKVEYSEAERMPKKKKRKKHRKLKAIFTAVLTIFIVLGIAVALMMTVFFNVTSIKVIGSSIYTSDEIIYASGIINGDNLVLMQKSDIEARIEKSLPYIKRAEIISSYPDSVGISVEPAEEKYIISNENGQFVADNDFKILRTIGNSQNNLVKLVGVSTNEIEAGLKIEFVDNQQKDIIDNIFSICADKGFNLSYIDVTKSIDISFVINERILVQIGSYTDLGGKITHLTEVVKGLPEDEGVIISLKDWSIQNKESILKYDDINNYIK